jgi:hypothetical protein
MHEWSPSDWVLVLGAVFAGFVSLITAWKTSQTKKVVEGGQMLIKASVAQSKMNEDKIDQVRVLTDGNLGRTQADLDVARKKVAFLERLITAIATDCRPGAIELARRKIELEEAAKGKRRKADLAVLPLPTDAGDLSAGPAPPDVPDSPKT